MTASKDKEENTECFLTQNESSKGLVIVEESKSGQTQCGRLRPTVQEADLETVPKCACRNIPVIITSSLENAFYRSEKVKCRRHFYEITLCLALLLGPSACYAAVY